MPDIVLSEFAGVDLPAVVDALLRIVFIVALMTVNALALIYLERKVLARFHQRVGPTAHRPLRHTAIGGRRPQAHGQRGPATDLGGSLGL